MPIIILFYEKKLFVNFCMQRQIVTGDLEAFAPDQYHQQNLVETDDFFLENKIKCHCWIYWTKGLESLKL